MSLEHSPVKDEGASSYWCSLIDEKEAADFLGVTDRSLQAWRQKGNGPNFIRISSRCIRYTRRLLKEFADARLCSSTAEYGGDHAA